MKTAGLDMATTYEAVIHQHIFVHETESQVILNGSRDINFTMDLVLKDIGLFNKLQKTITCRWKSPLDGGHVQRRHRQIWRAGVSPIVSAV